MVHCFRGDSLLPCSFSFGRHIVRTSVVPLKQSWALKTFGALTPRNMDRALVDGNYLCNDFDGKSRMTSLARILSTNFRSHLLHGNVASGMYG